MTLRDLLAEPHQEHRAGDQRHHGRQAEHHARIQHQPGLGLKRNGDAEALEKGKPDRPVTGVLRNLAPTRLAFLLELLERGHRNRHQLHDDGRRDVGHDAQREDRETGKGAAGEQVEDAENPALLPLEEFRQARRIDTRHRDVRPDPIDQQRTQQEPQPAPKVAELSGLAQCIRRRSGQGCALSMIRIIRPRRSRPRNRPPPRWQPWHPSWPPRPSGLPCGSVCPRR